MDKLTEVDIIQLDKGNKIVIKHLEEINCDPLVLELVKANFQTVITYMNTIIAQQETIEIFKIYGSANSNVISNNSEKSKPKSFLERLFGSSYK